MHRLRALRAWVSAIDKFDQRISYPWRRDADQVDHKFRRFNQVILDDSQKHKSINGAFSITGLFIRPLGQLDPFSVTQIWQELLVVHHSFYLCQFHLYALKCVQ